MKIDMKQQRMPYVVSAVPSATVPQTSRATSLKRLSRVRMSWFLVGSVFGVGLSFFISTLFATVALPAYHYVASHKETGLAAILHGLRQPPQSSPAALAAVQNSKQAIAKEEKIEATATVEPEKKPAAPALTYPLKLALKLAPGQTLSEALTANHVSAEEARKVVSALQAKLNPQTLKPGQPISVTLARHESLGDGAAVRELAIKLPNLDTIALKRMESGGFNVAETKNEEAVAKSLRKFGKVRSSLYQAAGDASIPMSAMNEILKAYSYDIDFQREIHPGDTIEVLMEPKTGAKGEKAGTPNVPRAAILTLQGKKHAIYRFKNTYGEYSWFDDKGNSVKKSLLRTPLEVAHLTSGFGMRTHPIMGYSKMHKGADFGAASGTPIMAAGDGTVEFKGWKGGYGNFVLIRHNNTYQTAYAHMSKFANISEGNRVKQGQVIGYVGSTGASTGAHLHYEVRQNDEQVNPVSKQFNMANGLTGKQLAAFEANKTSISKDLVVLAGGKLPAEKSTKQAVSQLVDKSAKPLKNNSKKIAAKEKTSKEGKLQKSQPQKLASR